MRVLDIGCGVGGCAFQMARDHGVTVDGIDISRNMIEIGRERCAEAGLDDSVSLRHGTGIFRFPPEVFESARVFF